MERPQPQLGTQGDVVWKRAAAVILDTILIGIVGGIVGGVFGSLIHEALGGLVSAAIFFGYFIYMEAEYGQTLGKKLLGIMVVTEDGRPIDTTTSAIRNVLRVIDNLPVLYLVGIVAVFLTDNDQRLGDLAADTFVVETAE